MNLSVGIVGLPNAGKSTLFNALLKRQIAHVAEYPFTTIQPNTGVVEVPDERLEKLAQIVKPEKIVPAAVEFIDIAGLVKGAHEGQGLGNAFLGHIREVHAVLHVVRFFGHIYQPQLSEHPVRRVSHIMGTVHPLRDIEVVDEELSLAGIRKPTLYLINIEEKFLKQAGVLTQIRQELKYKLRIENVLFSCVKLEAEISELPSQDQEDYLKELGVEESSLDQVIRGCCHLLSLITFFTIKGGKQVQAWPLKNGKTAIEAAGEVHTDMARSFIKAEVVSFEDLWQVGSWVGACEAGKVRLEGRDYQIRDGDVVEFKFSAN